MKRVTAALLGVLLMMSLTACRSRVLDAPGRSGDQVSEHERLSSRTPESESEAFPAVPIEITQELFNEIMNRMGVTRREHLDAPGALGEFLREHPDFLLDQSGRVQSRGYDEHGNGVVYDGGEHAQLLLRDGVDPGADLINRPRLALFAQRRRAGIPDQIAVISSGPTIPVKVAVFTGGGSETGYSVEIHSIGVEDMTAAKAETLVETDREWRMIDLPHLKIRYPKYGYEPIPLSAAGVEVDQEEAGRTVADYARERYSARMDQIVPLEPEQVGGIPCYIFEARDKEGFYTGIKFAAARDLSRIYEIEQVGGEWLLQARPKAANAERP